MNDQTPLRRNAEGIATALDVMRQSFGDRLQTGAALRAQHAHTTTWLETQPPDAVFFPRETAEVQEVLRICSAYGMPLVPFGTGTSLEGHVNAPLGGLSLDFSEMNKVLAVHPEDMDCVVQPGITRKALNEELRATGLFFPVDPGADASIGGMAATRASGTNAVRYGTMRDAVIAVEAVTADGRVMRTAQRARKTSAGYDLTRLLVGSEGTLAVITELTLRLHGIPEAVAAATCSFPSVAEACNAVIETIQYGVPVARIEFLDVVSIRGINAYSGLSLPEAPLLLLEFHGSEAGVAEQSETFGEIAAEHGALAFDWTADAEARTAMWQARHDAYWAMKSLRPGADVFVTDVCVPVSKLAEAVTASAEKAEAEGFIAPTVGHVGDGNFHVALLIDPEDPSARARAEAYVGWLNDLAISLGGTCTGEHGIGQGKAKYLGRELGQTSLDMMAAVKQAMDPDNILNPGKLFQA
ncbi:FAD-binding oxidoreductase [Dinoroseobacter sp. S375]|uniref:FAD-binding oxidoreductase n=1 Tax=Dinoroseobacter sp. S375 TaxID=3415136 RepID=UPI003C7DD8B8